MPKRIRSSLNRIAISIFFFFAFVFPGAIIVPLTIVIECRPGSVDGALTRRWEMEMGKFSALVLHHTSTTLAPFFFFSTPNLLGKPLRLPG